uniref:Uncharacterized protein n=1 Tax=Anguilla anguilla TaxID=7936 RepID=A0A0E9S7F9_ANGAN
MIRVYSVIGGVQKSLSPATSDIPFILWVAWFTSMMMTLDGCFTPAPACAFI